MKSYHWIYRTISNDIIVVFYRQLLCYGRRIPMVELEDRINVSFTCTIMTDSPEAVIP